MQIDLLDERGQVLTRFHSDPAIRMRVFVVEADAQHIRFREEREFEFVREYVFRQNYMIEYLPDDYDEDAG